MYTTLKGDTEPTRKHRAQKRTIYLTKEAKADSAGYLRRLVSFQ